VVVFGGILAPLCDITGRIKALRDSLGRYAGLLSNIPSAFYASKFVASRADNRCIDVENNRVAIVQAPTAF